MTRPLQVLAVIAHHGTKNRAHLDRMFTALRAMDHEVTLVVVAEEPKDLPDDVEVVVGLPSDNPWSLPFAHRAIMAARRDDFDVFLYSEDDTLVEQRHVDRHVELSAILPDHLIPGLQRYELHPDGRRSYCSIHSHYRWDPRSVMVHEALTFARMANDHGAATLATRDQLRRAIDSGGFLVDPHEGDYDMLVSAATDLYTQCGMDKVFCLEKVEDQLVHHLPNVYLDRLGISEDAFNAQIAALIAIGRRGRPSHSLFDPTTSLSTRKWDRMAFPDGNDALLDLVPPGTRRVLSLGTASGQPESVLVRRGIHVTAVPLDPVLGAVATHHGIDVIGAGGPWQDEVCTHGSFDVVLALDLLSYLEDPVAFLRAGVAALRPGGTVLATAPDHRRFGWRNRLLRSRRHHDVPERGDQSGYQFSDPGWLARTLRSAGVSEVHVSHRKALRSDPVGHAGVRAAMTGSLMVATGVAAPGTAAQPVHGNHEAADHG